MTKILHLLSQIPAKTGSGVFFENIVREFHHAGYEQEAILGLPVHLANYSSNFIEKIHPVLFETPELPFKIPGMSDVMPYESSIFSSMDETEFSSYKHRFSSEIKEVLLNFQPDIVLTHHLWLTTAFACELLQNNYEKGNAPKIFTVCHGTDLRQLSLAPKYKEYVTDKCGLLDGVFSLHTRQKEEILSNYPIEANRIKIIGNGFNSDIFHSTSREKIHENEKHELIYAGKLSYSKGVRELIRALELLPAEKFSLSLAGSGSGPETLEIEKMIGNSKADIKILGQVSQSELALIFKQADILVLPSFYEGLPLVILEALATGLKVVVNDLEGLKTWVPEKINESGNIIYVEMPALSGIDTISEKESAKYILKLRTSLLEMAGKIEKRRHVPIEYYDVVMNYSWPNIFRKIEQVFFPELIP